MFDSKFSGSGREARNTSDAFLTTSKRHTIHLSKDQILSPGPAMYEGKGDDMYMKMLKKRSIHSTVRQILDSKKNVLRASS